MLTIDNLKAGYEGKTILEITKMVIPHGEHCLILGKSGSGKTTLLYAIAGLLKPFSGEIRLNNEAITDMRGSILDAYRGKHIGIIFQTLHMVAALSIIENILLAQYAAGIAQDTKKAERLLTQLGLTVHRNKQPAELSQGQQQRVAIARAAINAPQILLCDEPTSALDDEACESVMQLLLDTATHTGSSLIVATHDARIKKHFSKNIITLGESQ